MEEVWDDISLSCLQDRTPSKNISHHDHAIAIHETMTLQDFLSKPFHKGTLPPPPNTKASTSSVSVAANHDFFTCNTSPRNATMLNLNSSASSDFDYTENRVPIQPINHGLLATTSPISPFDVLCKKRENLDSGDRRVVRMMKNRESAARSRARKQAYTRELEQVRDDLKKENDKLKEQQKRWVVLAKLQKKKKLLRTSTAPF